MRQRITEKKTVQTTFGQIEIAKRHDYSECLKGARYSPYMKELIIFAGQGECYEQASETLEKFTGVKVSDSSIYRITCEYGSLAEVWLEEEREIKKDIKADEVMYAQVDGGMLLMRKEGWKENKIGRVFRGSDRYSETDNRLWIKESEYVSHLGGHQEFERKMSILLDEYSHLDERLVVISDGAEWIRNWIQDEYPRATLILDYYHSVEYLNDLAKNYFDDEQKRKQWTKLMKKLLLRKQGVYKLIDQINLLPIIEKAEEVRQTVLKYYHSNVNRMNYYYYRQQGWIIGSGAVEAAHRTVAQRRLKLSGQRWTKKGAQSVLNLRVLRMSGYWKVLERYLGRAA